MHRYPQLLQSDHHSCGPVCYRMVCGVLGIEPRDLRSDPDKGTQPWQIRLALNAVGVSVLHGSMTFVDLAHLVRDRPVIVLVDRDGVGHYQCVRGISTDGKRVSIQCPIGGRLTRSRAAFLREWDDVEYACGRYKQFGIAAWRW